MNPYQISARFNYLKPKEFSNYEVVCRPKKNVNATQVIKKGTHNSHKKNKLLHALNTLFGDSNFYQVIFYVNDVWLDPDYRLYLKKK